MDHFSTSMSHPLELVGQKRCKSQLTVKLIILKIEIFVVVNQLAVNISLSMFSIAILRHRTSDISCI